MGVNLHEIRNNRMDTQCRLGDDQRPSYIPSAMIIRLRREGSDNCTLSALEDFQHFLVSIHVHAPQVESCLLAMGRRMKISADGEGTVPNDGPKAAKERGEPKHVSFILRDIKTIPNS